MRFEHTLRTRAAPGDVWAVWADVARWPEWDVELRSAVVEGGRLVLGAGGTVEPRRGPASRFVVSEYEPGRGYAFTTRLPLCRLVVRRRLEDGADGGVLFTHEVSFVGPLSALFGVLLGRRFRAALPGVMENVRRISEARASNSRGRLKKTKGSTRDA